MIDLGKPKWKLVLFVKGERKEKLYVDPKKGLEAQKKLNDKGIKAHLVSRVKAFPPKGEPEDPDMDWCPWCRRWRYFRTPKNWYPFSNWPGFLMCPWCGVTQEEWYVRQYNPNMLAGRRRSRKKTSKRRRRVRI